MTGFDWAAVAALTIAALATAARAWLQSPRLHFAPNAPTLECAAYDLFAGACGLRAWILYEGKLHATMSEAFLAVTLAVVAAIGLFKVLHYARPSVVAEAPEPPAQDRGDPWPR